MFEVFRFLFVLSVALMGFFPVIEATAAYCFFCNRSEEGLKVCSRCHEASYCSAECQRAHWKIHKKKCSSHSQKKINSRSTNSSNGGAQSGVTAQVKSFFGHSINANTLMTGVLRYPHLVLDLLSEGREESKDVLLLGAGIDLRYQAIPQLHELQYLFPQSMITVVDNFSPMKTALECTTYEQMRILGLEMIEIAENFERFPSPLLAQSQLKKMLSETRDNLDLSRVELFISDFGKLGSVLERNYDVVVATNSLVYSLFDARDVDSRLKLFSSVIERVKFGGFLYIDALTLLQIVGPLETGKVYQIEGSYIVLQKIESGSSIRKQVNDALPVTFIKYGKSDPTIISSDAIYKVQRLDPQKAI